MYLLYSLRLFLFKVPAAVADKREIDVSSQQQRSACKRFKKNITASNLFSPSFCIIAHTVITEENRASTINRETTNSPAFLSVYLYAFSFNLTTDSALYDSTHFRCVCVCVCNYAPVSLHDTRAAALRHRIVGTACPETGESSPQDSANRVPLICFGTKLFVAYGGNYSTQRLIEQIRLFHLTVPAPCVSLF